jgi:hypothetical protein
MPAIDWYPGGEHARITDTDGTLWWLLPNEADGYRAECQAGGVVKGFSKVEVLEQLLPDHRHLFEDVKR